MNEIKEYVKMGYLTTFSKYKEPSVVYAVPRTICERVMKLKDLPTGERPQIVDLTQYGYGYESLSMIRGAKEYNQTEGQLEFYLMTLTENGREEARKFITERRGYNLICTQEIIRNRCEEHSIL